MVKPNVFSRRARFLRLVAYLAAILFIPQGFAFAADLDKGKDIYLMHCAGCHGDEGLSLMPQVPNFARGEGLAQPDPVLMDAIRIGSDRRPPFLGILNDREIFEVISYARTLLR